MTNKPEPLRNRYLPTKVKKSMTKSLMYISDEFIYIAETNVLSQFYCTNQLPVLINVQKCTQHRESHLRCPSISAAHNFKAVVLKLSETAAQ